MVSKQACPQCQSPLNVPQPALGPIVCAQCGTDVSSSKGRGQGSTAASSRRIWLLLGMVGVMSMVCCVPIVGIGIAWWWSRREPAPIVVEPVKKIPVKPPEVDPRIAIVQPAVDKGVAFIKTKVPDLKGLRIGSVGLNGLTLLECGVPPDDPAILRIAEMIRKDAPNMHLNYDLSPALFFLNRWDESRPLDEADRKLARTLALRIIAGQGISGIWGYNGVILSADQEAKLLTSLQDGTYEPKGQAPGDTSNTQFAALAIWGAKKYGVPVRIPLLRAAAYYHANQHADGCWNYPGDSLKASGTCAGLISLAIEAALLEDEGLPAAPPKSGDAKTKKRADVDKAFTFLAKTIGRKHGDPGGAKAVREGDLFGADALGDMYFLWALERVGVIYSKEVIDGKNWYDWAYPLLLKSQNPDGSWQEKKTVNFGPMVDTPFALLFLKLANIARDLTEIIRTRDGRVISQGK